MKQKGDFTCQGMEVAFDSILHTWKTNIQYCIHKINTEPPLQEQQHYLCSVCECSAYFLYTSKLNSSPILLHLRKV